MMRNNVPKFVRNAVSGAVVYGRRMAAWMQVLRHFSGRTANDKRILRRSALAAPLDMLFELHQWHEPALCADAEISVAGLGVFAVRGRSDDLGHLLPSNHAKLFAAIAAHLKPGDVAVDAGANIGAVTVFMARTVGSKGRVIAVEMMPETARLLRRNLSLNGSDQVEVIERALADKEGETLHATVQEGLFGQASLAPESNAGRPVRKISVATTTLDRIAEGTTEIALMKMDLEGAEPQALAGAKQMLSKTRAVVFESWCGGSSSAQKLLEAFGFRIEPIDARNYLALR